MAESYWDHIENAYKDVSIYDGAEVLAQGLKRHPPYISDLLAAHWFASEACNGGIAQFFLNPTGVLAPEAVRGFSNMKLEAVAKVVSECMALFGEVYPRDRDTRIEMLCESAGVDDPWDVFSSPVFERLQTKLDELVGADLAKVYDRMESYAAEKAG